MKYLLALLAAFAGAIICGPALAVFCELIFVSAFYGTMYESTAGWAAIYVAGPIGLAIGFIGGAWLVLRQKSKASGDQPPPSAFLHE